MIVLDTSILSLAFRRRPEAAPESAEAVELRRLIRDDVPLGIPGIAAQELLSGVPAQRQFGELATHLEGFPLLLSGREEHVLGARIANACRASGVAVATIDCLIAAQTIHAGGLLFTTDADFGRMARHCDLQIYPGPAGVEG